MRQLRSWIKQERASLADPRWRISLAVGAGLLVLVIAGETLRRIHTIHQLALERQSKDLDLLHWQVMDTKRTSQDWAHWNDNLAFVEGRNPKFPSNDMATTALLNDGAVMAVFSATGQRLAIAGATPEDRREGSSLGRCLRDLEQKRRLSGSTHLEVICPGEDQFYVGNFESISDNAAIRRTDASLAFLVPMLRQDQSLIGLAMKQLATELVLKPEGKNEAASKVVSPALWTTAAQPVRVLNPRSDDGSNADLSEELIALGYIVGVAALLILGLRMQWVLGQRRLKLGLRRQQRLVNQRIRRSEQALAGLLEQGQDGDKGDERRAFARLMQRDRALNTSNTPLPQNSERLTQRIETLLSSARSLVLQDPLTGLPNRSFFLERLGWELRNRQDQGEGVALLFINIDKFKQINETYGHNSGDQVLRQLASDLRNICGSRAFLARLGGDEFGLILNNADSRNSSDHPLGEQAHQLAIDVLDSVQTRTGLRQDPVSISLSIAVGVGAADGTSAMELMRRCDQAMSRVKQRRSGHLAMFDLNSEIDTLHDYRLYDALQEDLNQAPNRFSVLFQPIVDNSSMLLKVEALARWTTPQHAEIGPEQFFSIAERYRLILELGKLILEKTFQGFNQVRQGLNRPDLALAVNITPSQLEQPEFAQHLLEQLRLHQINPGQLTLEVTESAVVERSDSLTSNLLTLRQAGVRLALDDFGTGFSSLRLLVWLRPDELKIDKSFVLAATQDPVAHQIVLLLQNLSQTMQLTLVAEGVEDRNVLALLQEAGLNRFQGYLFAKAQSPEELVRNTASQPPMPAA